MACVSFIGVIGGSDSIIFDYITLFSELQELFAFIAPKSNLQKFCIDR